LVCGRGLGCELLRRAGADHVVGVDTRHEVIHWASQNLATHGLGFHNLPRGSNLPFAEGSFEIVVALNPNRGFGDVHFREVRRVLARDGVLVVAQTEPHGGTLQELLPFYDRAPIGEPVAPADTRLLGDLFGEPQVILEDPILAMHYRSAQDATDILGWPGPDSTLADDPIATKRPLARIAVYGLGLGQVEQRLVELPYTEVAERIEQTVGEYGRAREATSQENESLRAQLTERVRAAEQLETQLNIERERNTTATFEAVGNAASSLLYGWTGAAQQQRQPTNDPETEAYVQELWQSACDWKEHAERLTEQLREAGSVVSEREAELSRQISQLRGNLESESAKRNQLEGEVPALKAQLESAAKEGVQRDEYLSQLRTRLEEKESRLDQFAEEMAVHLEDLHVTKRELDRANQSLDSVAEKKEKVAKETVNLDQAVRTKSARIQTLEREAMSRNIEISALEKEAGRLLKAKAEADRETKELKDKLAKALAEVASTKSKPAAVDTSGQADKRKPRVTEPKKVKKRPAQPELALGSPIEPSGAESTKKPAKADPKTASKVAKGATKAEERRAIPKAKTGKDEPSPAAKKRSPRRKARTPAEPGAAEAAVEKTAKTATTKGRTKAADKLPKGDEQETAKTSRKVDKSEAATAPPKPKKRSIKAAAKAASPKTKEPAENADSSKKKTKKPADPKPRKRKTTKKSEAAVETATDESPAGKRKPSTRKPRKAKADGPAVDKASKTGEQNEKPKPAPKKRTRTRKKADSEKPAEKEATEPKPKRKRTRSKPADK